MTSELGHVIIALHLCKNVGALRDQVEVGRREGRLPLEYGGRVVGIVRQGTYGLEGVDVGCEFAVYRSSLRRLNREV